MLDSKPRGHGFDPHRRHCVVVLEQDTFILATGSTQEDTPCLTERLLMGRKESNQTKSSLKCETFSQAKEITLCENWNHCGLSLFLLGTTFIDYHIQANKTVRKLLPGVTQSVCKGNLCLQDFAQDVWIMRYDYGRSIYSANNSNSVGLVRIRYIVNYSIE